MESNAINDMADRCYNQICQISELYKILHVPLNTATIAEYGITNTISTDYFAVVQNEM